MIQKKTIEDFGYLRGFAILAILAIHTSTNFTQMPEADLLLILNMIISIFGHYAVPLFIFIAGFGLSSGDRSPFSEKVLCQKRIVSLLPQYVIFSIFYVLFDLLFSAADGDPAYPSLLSLSFNFLTANSSYHLWYFLLIIQFYVLYPYIITKYRQFEYNGNLHLLILFSFLIQELWLASEDILKSFVGPTADLLLTRVFLSHIFYFVLGIYICQNYRDVKDQILKFKKQLHLIVLLLTGVLLVAWIHGILKYGSFYDIPLYYFVLPDLIETLYFSVIILILLIVNADISNNSSKISDIVLRIGKYSFGIYLIHVSYMRILVDLIYPGLGIGFDQMIFYPVLFVSTLLLSYFTVHLVTYLPQSEVIMGVKSNRN